MTTKLAGQIKQERVRQGLNMAELTRKLGYAGGYDPFRAELEARRLTIPTGQLQLLKEVG